MLVQCRIRFYDEITEKSIWKLWFSEKKNMSSNGDINCGYLFSKEEVFIPKQRIKEVQGSAGLVQNLLIVTPGLLVTLKGLPFLLCINKVPFHAQTLLE